MKRFLALAILLVLIVPALLPEALAQVNTKDTVEYTDPGTKKDLKATGKILTEGPIGITIQEGAEAKQIPALAITHVTYAHPRVGSLDFRKGFTKEFNAGKARIVAEKKILLEAALTEFQTLANDIRDNKNAYRYIQYKIVQVKVEMARIEPENKLRGKPLWRPCQRSRLRTPMAGRSCSPWRPWPGCTRKRANSRTPERPTRR